MIRVAIWGEHTTMAGHRSHCESEECESDDHVHYEFASEADAKAVANCFDRSSHPFNHRIAKRIREELEDL